VGLDRLMLWAKLVGSQPIRLDHGNSGMFRKTVFTAKTMCSHFEECYATDWVGTTSHPVANVHPEWFSQPFPLPQFVLVALSLVCLHCVVFIASIELCLGYPHCCWKRSEILGSITDSTSRKFLFACNS
jgi:hypothetical protein